jgi:hypothetical protein
MKATIKKIVLYVLFCSIPMGVLYANEDISEWQKMVEEVRSETNKDINQNTNYQTATPQIQNGEINSTEKIINPNYIRLKQELANIDNQIFQIQRHYKSQETSNVMNQLSSIPFIGGGGGGFSSLFSGATRSLTNLVDIDAQRSAQLEPLRNRKYEIHNLLQNTPEYISKTTYAPVSHSASVVQTKNKAFMVIKETNVMSEPSDQSEILGTIPKECSVRIYELKNGWAKVGNNKWILEKYLLEMAD